MTLEKYLIDIKIKDKMFSIFKQDINKENHSFLIKIFNGLNQKLLNLLTKPRQVLTIKILETLLHLIMKHKIDSRKVMIIMLVKLPNSVKQLNKDSLKDLQVAIKLIDMKK